MFSWERLPGLMAMPHGHKDAAALLCQFAAPLLSSVDRGNIAGQSDLTGSGTPVEIGVTVSASQICAVKCTLDPSAFSASRGKPLDAAIASLHGVASQMHWPKVMAQLEHLSDAASQQLSPVLTSAYSSLTCSVNGSLKLGLYLSTSHYHDSTEQLKFLANLLGIMLPDTYIRCVAQAGLPRLGLIGITFKEGGEPSMKAYLIWPYVDLDVLGHAALCMGLPLKYAWGLAGWYRTIHPTSSGALGLFGLGCDVALFPSPQNMEFYFYPSTRRPGFKEHLDHLLGGQQTAATWVRIEERLRRTEDASKFSQTLDFVPAGLGAALSANGRTDQVTLYFHPANEA